VPVMKIDRYLANVVPANIFIKNIISQQVIYFSNDVQMLSMKGLSFKYYKAQLRVTAFSGGGAIGISRN
jgi:hypothetical protein